MRRADWWYGAAAVLLLSALAFDLDGWTLLNPDEGRNATVMREMADGGDWILPHLDGLPYLDKPAVYFATGAAAMKVLGPTDSAARFPSLLFTLAGAVMLWLLARRLFGMEGAWVAALAFLATPLTIAYARTVIFDSALVFWVLVAMWGFWNAMHTPRGWPWSLLAWAGVAAGILTKGPVILIYPLLVVLPWALWRGEKRWKAVLEPVGLFGAVAIVLPWVWAVSGKVPGYVEYVLLVETAQRFATGELQRSEPFWYFLPLLPVAALPWSAVVLGAPRRLRALLKERDGRTVFLLLWIVVPLLFFTLAQSKRPQYILPMLPAVVLLMVRLWHVGGETLAGVRTAAITVTLLGAALVAGRDRIGSVLTLAPDVAAAIPTTAMALGIAMLVGGSLVFTVGEHREKVLFALCLPVAAIPFLAGPLMRTVAEGRSSAGLARVVAPLLTAEAEVIAIDTWPPGLGFYLGRQVLVSSDDLGALTSNWVTRHPEDAAAWPDSPLRSGNWWQRALLTCNRPRVFLVPVNDAPLRALIAGAAPFAADVGGYAVYGPCGAGTVAGR